MERALGKSDPSEEARIFRVHGVVQGVGYRMFAEGRARQLGLTGWVRNCSDGSVELFAQGLPATLDDFEESLAAGPIWAEVHSVTAVPAQVESAFDRFEIR